MRAETARRLFDSRASSYDRVNRLISLGLDRRWRRWVARAAGARPGARVLDAFAGTGAAGIEAAVMGADVVLADVSPSMLAEARRRAASVGVTVDVVEADLTGELPRSLGPFDAVTVAFGTRYLDHPEETLRRLSSLLSPGGRLVVLEFVTPGRGIVTRAAGIYFFRVLPMVAGAISGDRELYDELTRTTRASGGSGRMRERLAAAGLAVAEEVSLGFGLVFGAVARRAL